mgnify:CR=1 FL=1
MAALALPPGYAAYNVAARQSASVNEVLKLLVEVDGFADAEIWDYDEAGNRRRAPDRDVHYAIRFSDPSDKTPLVIGFDAASEPNRADAMIRSRHSGAPAATLPMQLMVQEPLERFLAFLPVYPKSADLTVVMDRCVKIEHARLFGGLGWFGVNTGVISAQRQTPPA